MRKIFLSSVLALVVLLAASCSGKKDIRPEGSFDPERSLNAASERIESKEYEDARKMLFEVKNRDLTKKYAPLAQLKIADSYIKEEEYDLAVEEYKRFIEIYPDHKYASYAQMQTAMAYFVQIESPERGYGAAERALEEFERLKRIFPRNPYKEVIEMRISRCKDIIAEYEHLVADFYFKKGSYKAALSRFQYLLSRFPDYKKSAEVLYLIAVSHKRLGETDKAKEYYNLLIEKHPEADISRKAREEFAAGSR